MRLKNNRLSRPPAIIVIILCSFMAGRYSNDLFTVIAPNVETTHCTYVTDGDTIEVMYRGQEERVRLLDIDAPEIRKTKKLSEQAIKAGLSEDAMLEQGMKAKSVIESLVLGKDVELHFRGSKLERDSFGRLLTHVYVDGTNVASHLVSLGLAEIYE